MIFLISLLLAAAMIAGGKNFIKKHAVLCYLLVAAVSAAVAVCTFTGASAGFPSWVRTWVWPVLSRSALSTALFAAVMYAGAVPNGSRFMKAVMPIRGELSIIASILTLGHNISYGKTYFRMLFVQPDRLPVNQLLAAVCSLVMLCIMLPLLITSFKCVRRKMKGSSWKKLQRLAYGFYALIYVHVLLLALPGAQKGNMGYLFTVLLYSVVFLGYGAMRAGKALRGCSGRIRRAPAMAALLALLLVVCAAMPVNRNGGSENVAESTESISPSEEPQPAETPEVSAAPAETEEPSAEETAAPEEEQPAEIAAGTSGEAETVEPTPAPSAAEPSAAPAAAASPAAETPAPAETVAPAAEPEPVYQYKNGAFTGTGEGFEGPVTVSVSIENDKITGITVISSVDDEPYWSEGKAVISRILSAQSANVDTVSGATFSSGGIISAVRAALSSAKN